MAPCPSAIQISHAATTLPGVAKVTLLGISNAAKCKRDRMSLCGSVSCARNRSIRCDRLTAPHVPPPGGAPRRFRRDLIREASPGEQCPPRLIHDLCCCGSALVQGRVKWSIAFDLSSISCPSPSRPAWGWVVFAGSGNQAQRTVARRSRSRPSAIGVERLRDLC